VIERNKDVKALLHIMKKTNAMPVLLVAVPEVTLVKAVSNKLILKCAAITREIISS
jgi:hypothetical protein